ncbi:MAG: tRNA dimethylallyltransferase [Alphaproteobacteria bacterium MarineAlpha6_Bin4]|nr:MAG: tRNA dimethylallyltransferase [Alphaproteobacteria bacterium MarineAlpha6_Bin3]PPR38480.1 MAG: tRNA dimethylallyltransferase [Alphaproteobacteria bacterium MarineAlpha6_Bin4]
MLKENKDNKSKILVIAGPTATGKSSLAFDIAKENNGVIINADSQQIYKELPILSSQPNKKYTDKISHKLFNFLDFYNCFSVNQWFQLVDKEIKQARKRNKLPIIVGGTGMYLNTLLKGLKIFPKIPENIRSKGKKLLEKIGTNNFFKELEKKNKTCVYKINPNDKIRLLRSWEIFEVSNKSIYEINKKENTKKLDHYIIKKILIFPPRNKVYMNCKKRWNSMIKLGAIKEVELLIKKENKINKKNFIKTIGYKELKNFLLKKNNFDITSEIALKATRNYAKRQYTWFRNQFSANIIFKSIYDEKTKKFFLKEIQDKLLTNQ